jgi:hypothetical protein
VRSAVEIFRRCSKIDEDGRVESVCALHQFSIAFSTGEISPLRQLIDTSLTTNTHLARNSPSVVVVRNIFFRLRQQLFLFGRSLISRRHSRLTLQPGSGGRTRRRGYFAQFVKLRANKLFVLSSRAHSQLAESVSALSAKCAAQQFKTWS